MEVKNDKGSKKLLTEKESISADSSNKKRPMKLVETISLPTRNVRFCKKDSLRKIDTGKNKKTKEK